MPSSNQSSQDDDYATDEPGPGAGGGGGAAADQAGFGTGGGLLRIVPGLLLVLASAPGWATTPQAEEQLRSRLSDSLRAHLQRIEEDLLEERWGDAWSSSNLFLDDVTKRVKGGGAVGPLLGMALLFRAVAEAGRRSRCVS